MTLRRFCLVPAIAGVCCALWVSSMRAQTWVYAKQGYSMRLCMDNRGTFGRTPYPGVIGGSDPGGDSVGLSYPIGQPFEHIFGAGLWVGGVLDTAQSGTSTPLRLVTTAYEGWSGPYFEFFPGASPADTIWRVLGRGVPRPSGWDAYWGNLIPSTSFSDNDFYCTYDDLRVRVANHVPLRLKVAQSSYVWSDPYAEEIEVMRYRIVNMGVKEIDSAYIGLFLDGDVGPYNTANFSQRNYSGFHPDIGMAYIHNPVDVGSTPVGITLLDASPPPGSPRFAYRWWGGGGPVTDVSKYQFLASGASDSSGSPANLYDVRCFLSLGPFTIRPITGPSPDTVTIVFGIVSGQNLTAMHLHAERARFIYANGGLASVNPPGDGMPLQFELFQNYPNPFNPTTTIAYSLPVQNVSNARERGGIGSHVTLKVYDILGCEVAVLVDGFEQPGYKTVRFDASSLASGVYFYRLESGRSIQTRKLILLR